MEHSHDASRRIDVDVAVVGAGPGGCAAAITARRHGLRVAVIDKSEFPRDKICGDGLTTNALRLLDRLGVGLTNLPSAADVRKVTLRSPHGREVDLQFPADARHFAAVVPRRELDARIAERARDAGAALLEKTSLRTIDADTAGLVIGAEGPEGPVDIHAKYAVAADGMWSPTRRLMGAAVDGYRGDWHGFRQYFAHVGPRAATELYVSFEPDIGPGYFWSFPLTDGGANVGFGIQRSDGALPTKVQRVQDMNALWPDILQRPHIREFLGPQAVATERHRAWPIPARIGHLSLSEGHTLFVGDAAAACDPMSGEGIGQALETGVLAAEAIAESLAGASGADAGALYRAKVKATMVHDDRMARLLARALSHRKGVSIAMAAIDVNDWTRRNFARWMFEDYARAAIITPSRWPSMRRRASGARRGVT